MLMCWPTGRLSNPRARGGLAGIKTGIGDAGKGSSPAAVSLRVAALLSPVERGSTWPAVGRGFQRERRPHASGAWGQSPGPFRQSLWLCRATAGGSAACASRSRWRRARSHAGHWRPREVAAVLQAGAAARSVPGREAAPPRAAQFLHFFRRPQCSTSH